MQNTQFLQWMRTLRHDDLPRFRQYLDLPPNASKKLAIALFEYLWGHEADWREQQTLTAASLEDRAIYAHLYPGAVMKPQRLRRVMMELRVLIENFGTTCVRSFLPPSLDHGLRTLLYLLERNSPLFPDRMIALKLEMEDYELSEDLPIARVWMEQMHHEYLLHRRVPEDNLELMLDYLDEYYLMVKLEAWTSMRTREYSYLQRHQYPNAVEVESLAATAIGKGKLGVALWHALFALVSSDDDPKSFQAAVTALEQVKLRLCHRTLRQVRGYLFNALMRSEQTDTRQFFIQLHELLEAMLSEGTLHLADGRLSQPFFVAYVRAACLCDQRLKAAHFVQAQTQNLVGSDPVGVTGYCNALIAYTTGNYVDCRKLLATTKSTDIRTEAQLRLLSVQLYFSTGDEGDFFRVNDSLRKFLARHPELGERFQRLVKQFSLFAERIGRVKFGWNSLSDELRKEMQHTHCAEKLWLLAQVELLFVHRSQDPL